MYIFVWDLYISGLLSYIMLDMQVVQSYASQVFYILALFSGSGNGLWMHGLFLSLFKLFGRKYTLKIKWKIQYQNMYRLLYCLTFLVQANLSETSPFFTRPNDCSEQLPFKYFQCLGCNTLYVGCRMSGMRLSAYLILLGPCINILGTDRCKPTTIYEMYTRATPVLSCCFFRASTASQQNHLWSQK